MMPRYMRGAKPLMTAKPAAVAPTSSGGVNPASDFRTARLQNSAQTKPLRSEAAMSSMQDTWNQGGVQAAPVDSNFQGAADQLGRMIEAGGPQGQPMANPSWDGTMFGVRLPQSQPTIDEARRQLDDMTRGGGVTAGPADPAPQPAPMPELPQRIRSRMVRAAGERPLMGRGYRL